MGVKDILEEAFEAGYKLGISPNRSIRDWVLFRQKPKELNYDGFDRWYLLRDPFSCPPHDSLYTLTIGDEVRNFLRDCWVNHQGDDSIAYSLDGITWFKVKQKDKENEQTSNI